MDSTDDTSESETPVTSSETCSTSINDASLCKTPVTEEACRKALAYMFIVDGLPFRLVEEESFRRFLTALQPFPIPSKMTLIKDCYHVFVDEHEKLMAVLKSNTSKISITTDSWTSLQGLDYMCLTAHYIDNDWKMQKKILNFCPVSSPTGKVLGMVVEKALNVWGIENLMTVTMDNASSNDVAISYLKQAWKGTVLKGDYLHMRCVTHIMNLLVQECLELATDSIVRVRDAVGYIRSSPARLRRFKACIVDEKTESMSQLCPDDPTKWNSTYRMLETALKFRKAFDRFVFRDHRYISTMDSDGLGRPLDADWNSVEGMVKLLATFHEITLRVSNSYNVTANSYFDEICNVFFMLNGRVDDEGVSEFSGMCQMMKKEFDKYWGDPEKMNVMIFIAVVFDPQCKMEYLQYGIKKIYPLDVANKLIERVKQTLEELFEEYKSKHSSLLETRTKNKEGSGSSFNATSLERPSNLMNQFRQLKAQSNFDGKSELDKYLEEELEDGRDGEDKFKILDWWKLNSRRFPVLSLVARDVLGIPVSTITSEFAFRTDGRVLDPFKSSLTPKILEALVCAQDWLRKNKNTVDVEEDLVDIEKIEEEFEDCI